MLWDFWYWLADFWNHWHLLWFGSSTITQNSTSSTNSHTVEGLAKITQMFVDKKMPSNLGHKKFIF